MKFNIPNICGMTLGPKLGFDSFLLRFGIKKRSRGKSVFLPGENGRLERYLKRQQVRLGKLSLKNRVHYWRLASLLLKRSKGFRILALQNVRPNWYKDMRLIDIERCFEQLNGICNRPDDTFEIHRHVLPKPDGGKRYINAPTLEWRLYLWMWNLMIHYFIGHRIYENQHGHRPGKGTVSAWKVILEEVINAKYIFEFDYMKFHDLIDRRALANALVRQGFPIYVARKLIHFCSAYAKGANEDDPMRLEMVPGWKYHHMYRGVVQGSNIAAYLGLIMLEDLGVYKLKKGKYIGYADDGLLYGDSPEVLEEWKSKLDENKGVVMKEAKSRWIKYEGMWLHNLKFVGKEFTKDGMIRAATHSGRVKEMKWESRWDEAVDLLSLRTSLPDQSFYGGNRPKKSTLTWKNGMKYYGLLTAIIWGGRSEDGEVVQDFELKGIDRSWLTFCRNSNMDISNVSSYAVKWLSQMLKWRAELSSRPKRASRGFKPVTQYRFALGGWMVGAKGVKLTQSADATEAGMNRVNQKFKSSSNDKIIGHTVKQPLGWDLMPSWSKAPTPVWKKPEWKTMIPPTKEDQLKLIEFAKKNRDLTKDYIFEAKSRVEPNTNSRLEWIPPKGSRIPMPFGLET